MKLLQDWATSKTVERYPAGARVAAARFFRMGMSKGKRQRKPCGIEPEDPNQTARRRLAG